MKVAAVHVKLKSALAIASFARIEYARNSEIDLAFETDFIASKITSARPLNKIELANIDRCEKKLSDGPNEIKWGRMEGAINDSIEKYQYTMKDKSVAVKGIGKIHESASIIPAHIMNFASYERLATHIKKTGMSLGLGSLKTALIHVVESVM